MEDFWKNFKNKWNEETHGKLVLDTSYVEERFNFLPQLPPRPSTNLQILPQISLHHDQSQTLLLQLLVILSRQVASDVGLHPGHDFAQSFVTELFHLTQHSGTEEYLLRFEHGPNRAKYLPLVSSIGLLLNFDHYFDYFFQNFPLPIVCIFIQTFFLISSPPLSNQSNERSCSSSLDATLSRRIVMQNSWKQEARRRRKASTIKKNRGLKNNGVTTVREERIIRDINKSEAKVTSLPRYAERKTGVVIVVAAPWWCTSRSVD